MCIGGSPSMPDAPEPTKMPNIQPRREAQSRVDPEVMTRRKDRQTDLRRAAAQRQSASGGRNFGPLENTENEL